MDRFRASNQKNIPHVRLMPSQMAPFCSSSRGDPISSAHGSRWLRPRRTLLQTDKTRNYQRTPSSDLRLPLAPVPQLSAENAHTFPHLSVAMLRHRAADKEDFQSVFSPGNMSWFFSTLIPVNGPFQLGLIKA